MGQTLANHSYVDLSQVGRPELGGEGVQCITDLATCCSGDQGRHRGDWYFPNGTRLPFSGDSDIYEYRNAQRVYIRRNSDNSPTGIYMYEPNLHYTGEYNAHKTPQYVTSYMSVA